MSPGLLSLLCCALLLAASSSPRSGDGEDRAGWSSALQQHLAAPPLLTALRQRCHMRCYADKRVIFTHIPKTGGSSVKLFLRKTMLRRYTSSQQDDHEFFLDSYRRHPFEVFVTLFREPVAQAISFYHYVNDRQRLPLWVLSEERTKSLTEANSRRDPHIWRYSFRRDVREWAGTEWVQRSMAQMLLRQFTAHIENVTNSIADSISWRSKKDEIYPPVVPWLTDSEFPTLDKYMAYLQHIPEKFRCEDYIKVAYLLLSRFSAVGTLEQLEAFYRVILHRTKFTRRQYNQYSSTNVSQLRSAVALRYSSSIVDNVSNKTREDNTINLRELASAKEILTSNQHMQCASLLWRIASETLRSDDACFSET